MSTLNGHSITQGMAAKVLGIEKSYLSRQSDIAKDRLMAAAIRLQQSEKERNGIERDFTGLEIKCNNQQHEITSLQSLVGELKKQINNWEQDYRYEEEENKSLILEVRGLEDKCTALQSENAALQLFKAKHEGKNAITRALGHGLATTLLAIALASFNFFALWELMQGFLGEWKPVVVSGAVALALLHFTIRKNQTGRAVCVVAAFIIAGLFSAHAYSQLSDELQNGWSVSVAVLFTVLVPTLEFLTTKEIG